MLITNNKKKTFSYSECIIFLTESDRNPNLSKKMWLICLWPHWAASCVPTGFVVEELFEITLCLIQSIERPPVCLMDGWTAWTEILLMGFGWQNDVGRKNPHGTTSRKHKSRFKRPCHSQIKPVQLAQMWSFLSVACPQYYREEKGWKHFDMWGHAHSPPCENTVGQMWKITYQTCIMLDSLSCEAMWLQHYEPW